MCLDIHPVVEIFGVCDNYEKIAEEFKPLPT